MPTATSHPARSLPRSFCGQHAVALFVAMALLVTACSGSTPAASATDVEAQAQAYLAAPSSNAASDLVATMASTGDERWVPWLLDVLRVQPSTAVSTEIGEALATITGVEGGTRIQNMTNFGSWAQERSLDGGEGYPEFKAAMYEQIDAEFGPLLRTVVDQAELAAIQYGGVPRGGIPELNSQPRVPAAEADWMVEDQVIMGVVVNGEAVAYPLALMQRHELANDVIGGEPVAVVYCTLCRTGLVFRSTVNGQLLNFETSGLLLNSNKIMVDVETDTLWHHLRGLGIGGEMVGTKLELLSVNHMQWSDWVAENPNTTVPTLPGPIFFDDPERPPLAYDYTPGEAYRSYYESDALWFPAIEAPDTFEPKTEIVGIDYNGDSVAFDVEAFNAVGETQIIQVGGQDLTVEPTGAGVRVFDPAGERLITEQGFWFAWFANHPETRTLEY